MTLATFFGENSRSFLKIKGFVAHCYTHDPTIFMKEGLPFPYGFSLEDPESLDVCVLLTLLHSAFFYPFSLSNTILFLAWPLFFDTFSSNTDIFLSINLSIDVLVFVDLPSILMKV